MDVVAAPDEVNHVRMETRDEDAPPQPPVPGSFPLLPALLGVLATLVVVALLFGLAFLKAGLFS